MLAASQACSEVCDRLFHRKWRLMFVMQPVFPTSSTLCWQRFVWMITASQPWLVTFSVPFMLHVGSDIWNVLLFDVIFFRVDMLILLKSWEDVTCIALTKLELVAYVQVDREKAILKNSCASQSLLCQWPLKPDEWWMKLVALSFAWLGIGIISAIATSS